MTAAATNTLIRNLWDICGQWIIPRIADEDVFSALLDGVVRLFFVDSFRLDTTGTGEADGAALAKYLGRRICIVDYLRIFQNFSGENEPLIMRVVWL